MLLYRVKTHDLQTYDLIFNVTFSLLSMMILMPNLDVQCHVIISIELVGFLLVVILGCDSALQGYTGPGTTWANEMNFVI